jgi:transcriptional regulator with GAF, ATPase, and Fis domain
MNQAVSDREQLVSRAFIGLADTLVDDYDMIDLLDRLVGYTAELLAADAAGIMLGDSQRHLRVVAASSNEAELMELLQLQNDQGPCMDCYRTATPVSVPDLDAATGRWPQYTAAIRTRGAFRSVHALPLRLRQESIGALNLFHSRPGPLPDADLALGQALADVATIGILQERAIWRGEVVNEQLQNALNSRVVIEQAKGVVAERAGLPMASAFDQLRRYARGSNQKLSDVARRLVERNLDPDLVLAAAHASPAGRSRPPGASNT